MMSSMKWSVGMLVASLSVGGASLSAQAATDLLSVGDSITEGARSTDTGGYRMFLDLMLTGDGVSHTWTGGRYNRGNGAANRGRFVQGNAYVEIPGILDPTATMTGSAIEPGFEPWNRHYGIGGISANNLSFDYTTLSGVVDYRRETYSAERSMLDRFVDASAFDPTASHAANLSTIRDSSINAGLGDFASTVFGTDALGDPQAPNTVIIGLGTNSLGSGSAASAAAEMHSLLNAYELLQAEGYFPANTRFIVMQIIPRITNDSGTVTQSVLEQTYDYNELLGDTNSSVYDDLSTSFVDQVEMVDLFRINAEDAYNDSQVVRDAAAVEGLADLAAFLGVADVDGDVWVDWSLGIDEADRASFSGLTDANADLFGFSSSSSSIDRLHPNRLGYSLIAYQISQTVPEPGSLALLAAGSLILLRRRRG